MTLERQISIGLDWKNSKNVASSYSIMQKRFEVMLIPQLFITNFKMSAELDALIIHIVDTKRSLFQII
jgi:hypothetical protein